MKLLHRNYKIFVVSIAGVLLVLCLFVLWWRTIDKNLCNKISFMDGKKSMYVVHPFKSGRTMIVMLPSGWDAKDILVSSSENIQALENIVEGNEPKLIVDEIWRHYKLDLDSCYEFRVKTPYLFTKKVKIKFFKSNIKTLLLESDSGDMDLINASKDKTYEEGGSLLALDSYGHTIYDGRLRKIRGHGNSSWQTALKKSYNIKLDKKAPLCSEVSEKSYSLISNSADQSGLENWIAYRLCDLVDIRYRTKYDYCNVYLNGHYNGLYLICNKIKVGNKNLNISDLDDETQSCNDSPLDKFPITKIYQKGKDDIQGLDVFNVKLKGIDGAVNPSDITGGYIIESHSRLGNDIGAFITKRNVRKSLKSPDYPTLEQVEYIKNFYDEFEDALTSNDGYQHLTHRYYADFIDLRSFAQYYLIQDFLLNQDAELASLFFYKDKDVIDPKLYAGPVWDMDGLRSGKSFNIPYVYSLRAGIIAPPNSLSASFRSTAYKGLFYSLFRFDDFKDEVVSEYNTVFDDAILRLFTQEIDSLKNAIKEDWAVNSIRWNIEKGFEEYINDYKDFYLQRRLFFREDLNLNADTYHKVIVDYNEGMGPYAYHLFEYHVKKGERLCIPQLSINEIINNDTTIVITPKNEEDGYITKIKKEIKNIFN